MTEITPKPMPATYAELAVQTSDTTHAEWESTLGPDYTSLRHEPNTHPEKQPNAI